MGEMLDTGDTLNLVCSTAEMAPAELDVEQLSQSHARFTMTGEEVATRVTADFTRAQVGELIEFLSEMYGEMRYE